MKYFNVNSNINGSYINTEDVLYEIDLDAAINVYFLGFCCL